MAVIFEVFEYIVDHGQDFIWNDIFGSDETRWLVVPLAIGLGMFFGLVLIIYKAPRWIHPDADLFEDVGKEEGKRTTIADIFRGLVIGASSLLAGAPLGPEMPLTESSIGLGKYLGGRVTLDKASKAILVISSIGALMVAFLGSLIMMALPFLLVFKQSKQLLKTAAVPIVLASLSGYGTLWLIDHRTEGYGTIPVPPHAGLHDYLGGIAVALAISIYAFILLRLLSWLAVQAKQIQESFPWYIAAAIFGMGVGLLYWIGGESVQFSGSEGSKLLIATATSYTTWALLGLAVVKLLVVAWAKASGYRGGLYFPSIFAGVALGLFIGSVFGSIAGPGIMIGAIAAIFAALGFPDKPNPQPKDYLVPVLISFLFIMALIPFKLIFLAMVSVAAATAGNLIISKFAHPKR